MRTPEQRADAMLRCYPMDWRERYGDEYAELLAADISDRPTSLRRDLDVAGHGLLARLSAIGLGRGPITSSSSVLATIGVAVTMAVICGLSMWEQLFTGWQNSSPDRGIVAIAAATLSVVGIALAVIAALTVVPLIAGVARAVRRHEGRALVLPANAVVASLGVLVVGGRAMAARWPGSANRHGGIAGHAVGFAWAETMAISTYWAHPAMLLTAPSAEVVWMVVSPMAAIAAVVGAVMVVRRTPMSARSLAFERRLAAAAMITIVPALVVAAWWVVTSQSDPNTVFRAGSLDGLLVSVMGAAIAVARVAQCRLKIVAEQ